jgi:hypothetical protein
VSLRELVAWLAIGTAPVAMLTACPQAAPVVQPTASCVAAVLADALQGMTVAQIVQAAGPGCVADVEEVVTILLGSGSAGVRASRAYGEAQLRRGK